MIAWMAGGVLGVLALLAVMNGVVRATPARLARLSRWLGFAALVALGTFFMARRIYVPGFLAWGGAFLVWLSNKGARQVPGGGSGVRTSEVETEWVRMVLDLDSGTTTGTVLKGALIGRRIETLSLPELRTVLAEARINNTDAARLMEAYISRVHPDAEPEDISPPQPGMTNAEALDVLGLKHGATGDDIRDAHRRLMQQLHPDKGGSDYFAAKINAARDLLLKDA